MTATIARRMNTAHSHPTAALVELHPLLQRRVQVVVTISAAVCVSLALALAMSAGALGPPAGAAAAAINVMAAAWVVAACIPVDRRLLALGRAERVNGTDQAARRVDVTIAAAALAAMLNAFHLGAIVAHGDAYPLASALGGVVLIGLVGAQFLSTSSLISVARNIRLKNSRRAS